ncbi:PSP1 domain-containing protein [Natribacillus halophilus]|uniref:Cell fate regulator YaaT, PSP1 superfamily (Controls sporulation, competence, biofilm development) n=1 Tax=Natribacillus halophilus TaxID=549003 RepID=A0A1G8SVH1_9BACI|nr:stage 0 sporulation family protein [Natribacillus halophilus]SDJ33248.1 Cell fate regulator YaaT, PSP1 superfamily (controls sporulation, competence, biofilm development) [Natribacillus halophilus]
MHQVIGIRFRKTGKIYYFCPSGLDVQVGQTVIVETARGVEHGYVVLEERTVDSDDVVLPLKKVVRLATPEDDNHVAENVDLAQQAQTVCKEKITEHKLNMKLVSAEYTFDRNKLLFYFTADGRVDFRMLVKDLASIFRTRVELRQIGVRDEAKILGGIGPCGLVLCCSTFLGDFEPVSIKMAKDQNLSLNPAKISGLCGRLMCCLKYENDEYEQAKKELPDIGEKIYTEEGRGKVSGLNMLERLVQVELEEPERTLEFSLEELIGQGAVTS